MNLVGNAIKFTETGEIVVRVAVNSQTANQVKLQFSVQDTGVGIPKNKQDQIFGAFSQADASTTRKFGGTGLGLAICTQLTHMMNGEMWVESEPGAGATFFFRAVLNVHSDQTPVEEKVALPDGTRVLVVDDNATNRKVFTEILRSWNVEVVCAEDGPAGLAELTRGIQSEHPFHVVILDCMMPLMDGFQFAEKVSTEIRERPRIVMVSSNVEAMDVETCHKLGIDRYMLKPVVQSDLLTTLNSVLSKSTASDFSANGLPEWESQLIEPRCILLVEDGIVNQRVAVEMLRDHNVTVAVNGLEAVEAASSQDFDIILMDVQMPEMDGLEATAEIRRLETESKCGRRVPIVAMTASAMKGDRERCLEAGMDGYIPKPIDIDELFTVIERFTGSLSVSNASVLTEPPTSESAPAVVDFELAAKQIPGGESGLKQTIEMAIEELDRLMATIETGLQNDNAKQVQMAAHTFKSTTAIFGASEVVSAAKKIEELASAEYLSEVRVRMSKFRTAWHVARSVMDEYLRWKRS